MLTIATHINVDLLAQPIHPSEALLRGPHIHDRAVLGHVPVETLVAEGALPFALGELNILSLLRKLNIL